MRKNNITLSFKNIILFLNNLIGHLTDNKKIITLCSRNLILCSIILTLSSLNIILCLPNNSSNSVSALSYSNNVNVGFTFNPSLSVSLRSSDLVIDNLTPGTTADSNDITISIVTNASYGYTLSANAISEDLAHSNKVNIFNSIATDADLASLTTDNTWGYSTSLDNGNSWSNYNGLSSSSSTTLLEKDSSASSSIDFKIAAKASSTQPSGEYANIINFTVVSNTIPTTMLDAFIASGAQMYKGYFKMQDMTSEICKSIDVEESELQLIDIRDDKVYWVAKLKDGNCWMTQNLDLEGNTKLSPSDTDFTDVYTLPTTNGWTTTEGKLVLPTSATDGFATDNYAYIYNSHNTTNCGSSNQNTPCFSYYSWDAATVGSGRNLNTVNADAPHSICPKGWKLPTARTTTAPNWQTESNFYTLAHQYGLDSDISTSEDDGEFYVQAGPGTISNFLLAGVYYYGSFVGIGGGNYWSSSSNGVRAFGLSFDINGVSTTTNNIRRYGCSVRCLAR